jgi:uncharacterized protein
MRTREELSIVCEHRLVPVGVPTEGGWVAFQLLGPFPFALTGVLASFLEPLAAASISVFALSTFDTDYVLVKHDALAAAEAAVQAAGHQEIK